MVHSQFFILSWKHVPYNSCTSLIWVFYLKKSFLYSWINVLDLNQPFNLRVEIWEPFKMKLIWGLQFSTLRTGDWLVTETGHARRGGCLCWTWGPQWSRWWEGVWGSWANQKAPPPLGAHATKEKGWPECMDSHPLSSRHVVTCLADFPYYHGHLINNQAAY